MDDVVFIDLVEEQITKSSAAGEWNGATASYIFTGDDVDANASNVAIRTNDSFPGDFEVTAKLTGTHCFGVYATAEDATFNQATQRAGMFSMTNSFWVEQNTPAVCKGSTNVATVTFNNGDTAVIKRVGATISVLKNGSTVHTYTGSYTGDYRLAIGAGNATPLYADVAWTF